MFEYLGYFGDFRDIILVSLPCNGVVELSGLAEAGTFRNPCPVVCREFSG